MMSKIDTLEIRTSIDNVKDLSVVNKENKPYIVKTNQRENNLFIALHVSRAKGSYNYAEETYTYEYFEKQLQFMYKDMGIKDYSKIELTRLDYCFDYKNTFDEMFKLNNMLSVLYGLEIKAELQDMIESNTLLEQQKSSITTKNRGKTKELYIYNKKLESKGRHPFDTRQEFRLKRLQNKTIIQALDSTYELLNRLYNNFYAAEQLKINSLYVLYEKELGEQQISSFSNFVMKYNKEIVTREICKELYYRTGHNGNFDNWLKKYKKSGRKIDFISKTQLSKMLKEMKRSMINFMGTISTLFLYVNLNFKCAISNYIKRGYTSWSS